MFINIPTHYTQKATDIAIHGVVCACAQGRTMLIGVPQSPTKFSHYTAFHDTFELHTRVYKTIIINATVDLHLNDNKYDDNSLLC